MTADISLGCPPTYSSTPYALENDGIIKRQIFRVEENRKAGAPINENLLTSLLCVRIS